MRYIGAFTFMLGCLPAGPAGAAIARACGDPHLAAIGAAVKPGRG